MKTRAFKSLLLAAALAAVGTAQAADVFFDNFDANTPGLNQTPAGWTVGNGGTVDVIGAGTIWDYFAPAPGYYIDLNGSTGAPGLLMSTAFSLTGGIQYVASFDLAGNQRNNDPDAVTVNFGDLSGSPVTGNYSLPMTAGWTNYQLLFTPAASGMYGLSFLNSAGQPGDNIGMLLDNVRVAAVPEPGTWALLLAGLGLMGMVSRRRLS